MDVHSPRISRAFVLAVVLAISALAATSPATASVPKLRKAGLTCQVVDWNNGCLLFISAVGPDDTLAAKAGHGKWKDNLPPWGGHGYYNLATYHLNPVRGKRCIEVRARIGAGPERVTGKARLCKAGVAGPGVAFDDAPLHAHWVSF